MSGAEIVTFQTTPDSENKNESVRCPDGKIVLGGGARITGPQGGADPAPAGVAIIASHPVGLAGEKSALWTVSANEFVEVGENWGLIVYGVCAKVPEPLD